MMRNVRFDLVFRPIIKMPLHQTLFSLILFIQVLYGGFSGIDFKPGSVETELKIKVYTEAPYLTFVTT